MAMTVINYDQVYSLAQDPPPVYPHHDYKKSFTLHFLVTYVVLITF